MAYASVTFAATGGTAMEFPPQDRSTMYVWSATGLPNGMSMSVHGVLSGTPTQQGTFNVQVTVADASNNVSPLTQTYTLNIAYAPLGFTTTTLTAVQGQAFNGQIVAQGGEAPYSISFLSGSLPAGMHFNDGTIYGTPTARLGQLHLQHRRLRQPEQPSDRPRDVQHGDRAKRDQPRSQHRQQHDEHDLGGLRRAGIVGVHVGLRHAHCADRSNHVQATASRLGLVSTVTAQAI